MDIVTADNMTKHRRENPPECGASYAQCKDAKHVNCSLNIWFDHIKEKHGDVEETPRAVPFIAQQGLTVGQGGSDMSIVLTVGDKKKKKRHKPKGRPGATTVPPKRPRDTTQGKGIRMVVSTIERIESCDEPGIHLETRNSIQHIDGVRHNIAMAGSKITVTLPLDCECPHCQLVIDKVGGGIGVVNNTGGGTVTMRF